jgi:hypothetical protein
MRGQNTYYPKQGISNDRPDVKIDTTQNTHTHTHTHTHTPTTHTYTHSVTLPASRSVSLPRHKMGAEIEEALGSECEPISEPITRN